MTTCPACKKEAIIFVDLICYQCYISESKFIQFIAEYEHSKRLAEEYRI